MRRPMMPQTQDFSISSEKMRIEGHRHDNSTCAARINDESRKGEFSRMNPSASRTRPGATQALLAAAAAIIVLAGVKLAADFITPIIIGFFIAVLSYPLMRWFEARRIPRALALPLTIIIDLSILVAFVFLAASLFSDFQQKWTESYQDRIRHSAVHTLAWTEETLQSIGVEGVREGFDSMINIDALLKLATDNVGGVVTGLTSVVRLTMLVLLLVGFMLADASGFVRKLQTVHLIGGPDFRGWTRVTSDVQKYLAIKTVVSLATGIAAWALCRAIGLDFALLWGIVAFGLNFIPAVGSIIASIPPLILALIQFGWPQMVIIAAGYFAINTIFGNIIEPTLQGRRFGISILVVLLSVLFWGWLLGIAGMFLAVPLTMLLKVALSTSSEFRWISAMLENEKSMPMMAQAIVEKVKGGDGEPAGTTPDSGEIRSRRDMAMARD